MFLDMYARCKPSNQSKLLGRRKAQKHLLRELKRKAYARRVELAEHLKKFDRFDGESLERILEGRAQSSEFERWNWKTRDVAYLTQKRTLFELVQCFPFCCIEKLHWPRSFEMWEVIASLLPNVISLLISGYCGEKQEVLLVTGPHDALFVMDTFSDKVLWTQTIPSNIYKMYVGENSIVLLQQSFVITMSLFTGETLHQQKLSRFVERPISENLFIINGAVWSRNAITENFVRIPDNEARMRQRLLREVQTRPWRTRRLIVKILAF
jgi:hypothetical protein